MVYKKDIRKGIIEWCIYFITVGVVFFGMRTYVFARENVDGRSMQPTLYNRDNLFAEKVSLITGSINRNEIITFDSENANHDIYIKRVIAIEGDEVEISNGKVYLNGEQLNESYLKKGTLTNAGTFLFDNQKIKIKKGFVFVLGDNRQVSKDSRYLGPISVKSINGHVILRIYPFNKIRGF